MTDTNKLDLLLSEIMSLKNNMATKDDIANMATKDDIANMATKDDIANMATKDDIANMATKDDIANMATKDDIEQIVTLAKEELYSEIIKAEKHTEQLETRINDLSDKVDMLLLKSDNTTLLLKLINQQADEIETLKTRLEIVEKKLA